MAKGTEISNIKIIIIIPILIIIIITIATTTEEKQNLPIHVLNVV
jgi:hypothetical protein